MRLRSCSLSHSSSIGAAASKITMKNRCYEASQLILQWNIFPIRDFGSSPFKTGKVSSSQFLPSLCCQFSYGNKALHNQSLWMLRMRKQEHESAVKNNAATRLIWLECGSQETFTFTTRQVDALDEISRFSKAF